MSDTPRTDKAEKFYFGDNRPSMETECVKAVFAETLERENTALRAHAERLVEALNSITMGRHTHVAGKEDLDTCDKCGKHLFNMVHFRMDESAKTDLAKAQTALTLYRAENPKV